MKNNTWLKILSGLAAVLILTVCILIAALFNLKNAVASMSSDFFPAASSSQQTVEISGQDQSAEFYQTLFSQMEKYGGLEASQKQSAKLITTVFEKTLKNCQVTRVDYSEDEIILQVEGEGVPLDLLDTALLTKAASSAAWNYLGGNFLDAAASLLQGEDGIKKQLYGKFAPEFLDSLSKTIEKTPDQKLSYRISLHIEDGKWMIDSVEAN